MAYVIYKAFYGEKNGIFHACTNSVFQALSPVFWEGPVYEANVYTNNVHVH